MEAHSHTSEAIPYFDHQIPSGKHTKNIKKLLKMAIEIVDLP